MTKPNTNLTAVWSLTNGIVVYLSLAIGKTAVFSINSLIQ